MPIECPLRLVLHHAPVGPGPGPSRTPRPAKPTSPAAPPPAAPAHSTMSGAAGVSVGGPAYGPVPSSRLALHFGDFRIGPATIDMKLLGCGLHQRSPEEQLGQKSAKTNSRIDN